MRALTVSCVLLIAGAGVLSAQRIKLPASLDALEKAVKVHPNDAAAQYNVALGYWNEKRYDDAEAALREAIVIEPRLAEAHLALAFLPYARRDKLWEERWESDLSDSLKKVIEISDREERHAYLINPLVNRTIIGAVSPKIPAIWQNNDYLRAVYELNYQGFDDFVAADYESAYFRYDKLLKEYAKTDYGRHGRPAPRSWLWYRALAAAQIGRTVDAISDLDLLIRDAEAREQSDSILHLPLNTNEFRYVKAVVYHQSGNIPDALRLYQAAAEADLGLYMAHVQMAEIYEAQRRYDDAIAERRRAVDANPDDPSLLMDLGVALGKAGKFGEAEEFLAQSHSTNPKSPMTVFWLGLAQMQQREYQEAKTSFKDFLKMAPERFDRQIDLAKKQMANIP